MILSRRRSLVTYGAAVAILALLAWGELARIGGPGSVIWWANGGWTLCAAVALAGCLVATWRGGPGRGAWLCFAIGCAVWLLGELAWSYYELVAHIVPPFPSLGDAGWLGCVPCFAVGISLLPRTKHELRGVGFFLLDFLIVATAVLLILDMVSQNLLITSNALDNWGKGTAMAYPVGYLSLGLGVFVLMLHVPSLAATRGIPWLLIGLLCEAGGFVGWTPLLLTNTYQDGTALDPVWMAGSLAIGLAGLEWQPPTIPEVSDEGTTPHLSSTALVALGLVPTILGTSIALLALFIAQGPIRMPLEIGASVLISLIALRQCAAVIDNARLYRAETIQRGLAQRHAERLQRRTSRSEAVGDLLHALGHHLEVDAVLRTGVEGLVRLTGADSSALLDYDPVQHVLIKRAGAGAALDDGPIGGTFSLDDEPHAACALQRCAIVAVTHPETEAEQAIWERLGCRAVLVVPLLSAGEPRGIVYINFRDTALPDSEEELRFVEEVADALAVALEKASLYERTRAQAMRDPVTDLSNHRAMHQALDTALAPRPEQPAPTVSLLLMDVDNFKLFNDTYGHPTGDAVLRVIAEHLRACSRDGDVAGRYGGDEFAVVLPGAERAAAETVARRLARAVRAKPYVDTDGLLIPLSVSIGIATAPEDGQTRQALLAVADARMYSSKHGTDADPILHRSAGDLLGETTFGILEGLVAAVDAKDRYTREHSLDVTRYALMLANVLDLDDADRRTLAVAGPLHDIGKIAVPDRVLRKPSALTADEYESIKAHVTFGIAIVRGILDDAAVLDAIAHHHERFDGRGYPQGLSGAETPLLGRIMQIADAVSAMTLDRPYRRGLDTTRVIAELRRGAGTQFDPDLVEPFIGAFSALRDHDSSHTSAEIAEIADLLDETSEQRAS